MRLTSIDVQEDGAFSRILFIGEGGEQISVRIARGAGDPVQRARAVMLQLANFDLAADDKTTGARDRLPESGDEP